jgi:TrmH family RNA methyltransferase
MNILSKAKLQYLKSLSQKKTRERDGVFLVEGWRSVEEACRSFREIQILVYTKEVKGNQRYESILSSAKKVSIEQYEASPKEFALIADTMAAQGIAAVVKKLPSKRDDEVEKLLKQEQAFVIALDQIADPGNLGAIIRTSDWFGLDAILLSQNCVELYNPKVVRSTVGSIFHLAIIDCSEGVDSFADALTKLRAQGYKVYGAEVSGSGDVRALVWAKKSVLVLGNEARGISPRIAQILDEQVAIPKFGKAESLNAGVAAGVFLAHHSFQLKK